MFKIGDRRIPEGSAFEHGGVLYPSNFLRLSTPQEKAAIGIEEVPDPAPVDHRFWFTSGDGPPVPRPLEQIRAMHIATIKSLARSIILERFPEWKQANMTARGTELSFTLASGVALSSDEQVEVAALQTAWVWIKSVRAHSNTLEAEIACLEAANLLAWQPHGWPAQS